MTTQTGPQLKTVLMGTTCRNKRRQGGRGSGSSLARALCVPADIPAPHTAQTHPQPLHQGTQGVGVAGGSRIVLAVLSTFDGMTGFNNLPLSPANAQVPP